MFARPRVVRRRPLLRAAAVGGTFAAGRAMGRRAEQQASAAEDQDQRIGALEDQQAQPTQAPAPPPAGSGQSSTVDQLGQLAALRQQGALTDEEFAAAKARLLGS